LLLCILLSGGGAGAPPRPLQKLVKLPGGLRVAAYALQRSTQKTHFAYAKAFIGSALDYWDVTDCFAKFGSERAHDDPAAAIDDVLQVALMSLTNIGFLTAASGASAGGAE
jgi:hypothetical protein